MSVQISMVSCDLLAATLGVCGCSGSIGQELEYQICAVKQLEGTKSEAIVEKPKRLCRYYTNGTIDVPTLTEIETYVDVGERLCIGDQIPQENSSSIYSELEEQLRAKTSRPTVSWEPGGELEVDVLAKFLARYETKVVNGELFGEPASIRFRAQSFRWLFSDGMRLSGRDVERAFSEKGQQSAVAMVFLEVDYQFAGEHWVMAAYSGEISSTELAIGVIEIPRRTLLVSG